MNTDKMRAVAWIGERFVRGAVTGVIVDFHGLGAPGLKSVPAYEEQEWADEGGLVVTPYSDAWNWMNRSTRDFVDDLIGAIYREYELASEVPLILTGGSMGGYCALLYARYARHRVSACQAISPVCDLKFHFSERPDLPRTIYHALRGYDDDLDAAFEEHSAIAQTPLLPRVPYMILHGTNDGAVNKAAHSDRMVEAMRARNLEVEYVEVAGMDHTAPLFFNAYRRKIEFVKRALLPNSKA